MALALLAKESEQEDSLFHQYKIHLDVSRPTNKNKNLVAENAVRECEKEILKHKPGCKTLTEEDLMVVAKIMNDHIRNRGKAAKEILIRRDLVTNKPLDVDDSQLAADQSSKRLQAIKLA